MTRVHSVFASSFNLVTADGTLITVADSSRDVMPMSINLEKTGGSRWQVQVDDPVMLQTTGLLFITSNCRIAFHTAAVWNPAPSVGKGSLNRASATLTLKRVKHALQMMETIGIAPLIDHPLLGGYGMDEARNNPHCQFIAPSLFAFLQALERLDWQAALAQAPKLIGFGVGLTPSCDDFLAAVLATLYYAFLLAPHRFNGVPAFNQNMAALATGRTTVISIAMLQHAASGKASRWQQQLILALLGAPEDDLDAIIKRVSQVGASSGSDFLFGFYCAARLLLQHLNGD